MERVIPVGETGYPMSIIRGSKNGKDKNCFKRRACSAYGGAY